MPSAYVVGRRKCDMGDQCLLGLCFLSDWFSIPSQSIRMKSEHFRDFDAFASHVRGVESTMMRHNPERQIWSIADVDLGSSKVQFGQLSSGNIAQGQSHAEAYLLYMPLTDTCVYKFNGQRVSTDGFAILPPNSEFCFSTKIAHDFCMAVISADQFADEKELSSSADATAVQVIEGNRHQAQRIRELVRQVINTAAACPTFEVKPAAKRANEELSSLASAMIRTSPVAEVRVAGRPNLSRKDIMDRAMNLIETRELELGLTNEFATKVGVSERTLRRVFNEYFGVGPARYLQLRQLHRIHQALEAADPEVDSVTEILTQNGEWELGRFASRYRRLFGELPSETLQAKRK